MTTNANERTVAKPHPTWPDWYMLPGGFMTTEANVLKWGYAIDNVQPARATLAPSASHGAKQAPRPAPVNLVNPQPSPIALAERVRAQRIIAMTPKGAEDECGDAIRSGMPVVEFEGVLAARAILDATRLVRGA